MPQAPFDPTKAVTFDLAQGLVHLEDAPGRLLVPATALSTLAQAAGPEARAAFAKALGEPLGVRVARRFTGDSGVKEASVEAVVDHLGGELALAGLGSLSLERWGRALLFTVDQSPLAKDEAGEALLGEVLAAALQRATGRDVRCVPLMNDHVRVRLLVTGAAAAEKARAWLRDGVSWGDVLARLHTPTEESRGVA